MADPFVGEIRIVGCNFAPQGWAMCQGQLLSISQNTALFSLLGTTYGGDGQSTFALPDLSGRVPMHPGDGPGLQSRLLGEAGGAADVTLDLEEIPEHGHDLRVSSNLADVSDPSGAVLGVTDLNLYATGETDTTTAAGSIAPAGGQPHNNVMPSLALNFIIALQGIFPQRP